MAREQTLTTRLVVDDEASKPVDAYAKKLDGLDNETIVTTLAIKAAEVQGQLQDVLADLAQVDSADPTIDLKVEHAAELKAELDSITGKIKEIGAADPTVNVDSALDTTKGKVKELGGEADNSRSVLANMAGNSAQDVGELGGVAGTAGVAIGQLAEYAADGNISLSGLAKVAGPMALLSVAIMGVTAGMKSMSDATASDQKKVDAWAESIKKGEDAARSLSDQLREAGKVEVNTEGLFGNSWFGRVDDASAAVFNVGLTFDTFAEIVAGGQEAIDAWGESARAAGKDGKSIEFTFDAMNEQLRAQKKAADDAEVSIRLQTRSLDSAQDSLTAFVAAGDPVHDMPGEFSLVAEAIETVRAGGELTAEQLDALNAITTETGITAEEAFAQATSAVETHTAAMEASAQAHRDNADALTGEVDALHAAADAQFAVNDAAATFAEKVAALPGVLNDPKSSLYDVRAALDGITQAAGHTADAIVDQADKQAAANGVTLSAKAKLDLWNKSMLTQASTLTGPARDAILDYIGSVNGISGEKLTDVKAALDTGSVDKAQTALDDVSVARDSAITAEAETTEADRQLDAVANQKRTARIDATVVVAPIPPLKLPAGTKLSGGQVTPQSVSSTTIVNLPRGARYGEINRAITQHARRAGRRYGVPQVHYARR